jgi:hypothetical protein
MDIRIQKMVNAFEENGWKNEGVVDIFKEWWFDEIIQFSSTWKPIGTKLYLTLLIDPIDYPKQNIWGVGISETMPNSDRIFIDEISLKTIHKSNLNLFVKKVNDMINDKHK